MTQPDLFAVVDPHATCFDAACLGYLLAHGRDFEPAPLRDDSSRGQRGRCFFNALRATMQPELSYCEGLAEYVGAPGRWFHHAWCSTADGTVQDPTWDPVGTRYFGIELSWDVVAEVEPLRDMSLLQHGLLPALYSARS